MKKRNRTQSFTDIIPSQKKSTHELNPNQKILIDSTIQEAFALNELEIVYDILNSVFKPQKSPEKMFDKLIVHDKNKIIYWALHHENLELINYMIDRASTRGKFLIVCLNNYELLDQIVQISFKKLNEGHYNEHFFKEVYKSFLKVNPEEVRERLTAKIKSFTEQFPEQTAKLLSDSRKADKELEITNERKSDEISPSNIKQPNAWQDKVTTSSSNKDHSLYNLNS